MRKKRGFTLIEVLFAIFLVVICAFIVAATMPISNASQSKASDLDKAMGLAQKQLEAIRGQGFPNVNPTQLATVGLIDSTNQISTNTYSFTNSDNANFDNPGTVLAQGAGSVKIEQLNLNLIRVTVTVSWLDLNVWRKTGQLKNFAVGTLIANL
ncbi:MAG TPA: prepilin-type N-terminal cleavage/methylation domain-containing protein [Fimbriimonadaceae bacterium]|jgi:prepilin-type N-terminal cleavage/methylation domain-containing protein